MKSFIFIQMKSVIYHLVHAVSLHQISSKSTTNFNIIVHFNVSCPNRFLVRADWLASEIVLALMIFLMFIMTEAEMMTTYMEEIKNIF